MSKADLKLDWCTHEAAKYAVKRWHYSKSMPPPPHCRVGAWECGRFIGCVLFARGAIPNLLEPYGLAQVEGCELVRVALRDHLAPVTRIVGVAIRFLRTSAPGLRLIVSFADPAEGHHGGIYQGGNWIYAGSSGESTEYIGPDGKRWHGRMVKKQGWTTVYGKRRRVLTPDQCTKVTRPGKHRYLYPLDPEMRAAILPLAQPYPKRAGSKDSVAPGDQPGEGGASPTSALHSQGAGP